MMSSDRSSVTLAAICKSVDYGYTASATPIPVGPKFLRITDIVGGAIDWSTVPYCEPSDSTNRFDLADGDVVIARTGASTGTSAYIRQPPRAVFASYLVRLQVDPSKADARWVSYFLRSPWFADHISGVLGDKSAQPNASAKTMASVRVPLPPIDEQRSVSVFLGALDDKIDVNRRMGETLEEIARTLFQSWFVAFDPTCGAATVPEDTRRLFPDRLVDSPIGPIPEGWRIRKAGEVFDVVGGSTPSTSEPLYWGGGIPFATPKDMSTLRSPVLHATQRSITPEGVATISSGLLPKRTVLMSSRAPIGYLALASVPVAVNQGIIAVLPTSRVPPLFVLHWLGANMALINASANGSTFQEISKRSFRQLPVVLPDARAMDAFESFAEPLYHLISSLDEESDTLAELRDTLLPRFISGEIRLHDGEVA